MMVRRKRKREGGEKIGVPRVPSDCRRYRPWRDGDRKKKKKKKGRFPWPARNGFGKKKKEREGRGSRPLLTAEVLSFGRRKKKKREVKPEDKRKEGWRRTTRFPCRHLLYLLADGRPALREKKKKKKKK